MNQQRKNDLTAGADGIIEGRNAVIEALRAGETIDKIYLQKGETDRTLGHIASTARAAGVVVVEAPKKSGALITAQLAIEQDRDLFTVPGNINSYTSEGTNQLLKDSCAKPVTETLDVLEEYLGSYGHLLSVVRESQPEQPERRVQRRSMLERVTGGRLMQEKEPALSRQRVQRELTLSGEERTMLDLLKEQPKSADALIKQSGLPVGKAMATLTMLEAKGYSIPLPGARFERSFKE